MSRARRLKAGMAVLGMALLPLTIVACGSKSTDTTAAPTTTATVAPANSGASIDITEFAFTPNTVTVKANQAVTWSNKGNSTHVVTATAGQTVDFKSETMKPASDSPAPFVFTFSTPGTYTYYCSIHGAAKMSGTVVVTPAS